MPRRGGGWPRVTVLPHSGKPTPPRFARLPLPEEGARMIFKETLIQSLSFPVRVSRFPPHMPRCSAFLICLSYRLCPIRPFGAPFPRGEGYDTRISSSKKAAHPPLLNLSAPQAPSSRAQLRDLYCTAAICTHVPSLKRHLGASFFVFPSLTIYRSARKIPPLRSG